MNKKIYIYPIILSLIGCLMIYSSSNIWSEFKYNDPYKYLISQLIFLIISIIAMVIVSKINYKIYYNKSNLIILLCFILLLLVLIPGVGTIRNGSRSWFSIGGLGFQPSELSKIGLIIFTSKYLVKNDNNKRNTKLFMFPILLVVLIFFGAILLEPDFGSGMVIVCSLIGLIFISGTDFSIFIKLGILGLIGIIILILIAPYRLDRITSFINPWSDPLGSGFQMIQSLFAIGPSGLLGYGLFNSRQKHFYLPEPQTDFILSITLEEFGFIGGIVIIGLYILLFYNLLKTAIKTKDLFGKYLIFGLSFSLIFQTALNMCVITGIVPITGPTKLWGTKYYRVKPFKIKEFKF